MWFTESPETFSVKCVKCNSNLRPPRSNFLKLHMMLQEKAPKIGTQEIALVRPLVHTT